MSARYLTLTIGPSLAGLEVNTLLRRHLSLSGTVLRRIKWLEDGICLDGVRVNVRARVEAGQTLSVRLTLPDGSAQSPSPVAGPLDIVHEDADLVVINKAPGILVHPGHGHFDDTVGNFLMAHYRQTGEEAGFHPVHRLDKGTSGLLVIAKHPHAQERLKAQLHTGRFHRVYLAICTGAPQPAQGVIDAPIGPVGGPGHRQGVTPGGKSSRTRYRVLQAGVRSLVELTLDTGRTHQIRVHMAHVGHPLTGDFLYGSEDQSLIRRLALHSAKLALTHPITGERFVFTCPMPHDMTGLAPPQSTSGEGSTK